METIKKIKDNSGNPGNMQLQGMGGGGTHYKVPGFAAPHPLPEDCFLRPELVSVPSLSGGGTLWVVLAFQALLR